MKILKSQNIRTTLPEKSFSLNCIVFAVIVEVHLDVARRDVHLVAALGLDAVVVSLLLVVLAVGEVVRAVVRGGDSTESVLERFLHLLVPLRVPDHLLLLSKDLLEVIKMNVIKWTKKRQDLQL